MESILTKLGTNYIISTFIPSLGFVLISIVIFEPIIPQSIAQKFPLTTDIFSESAALVLVLTIIFGFVLSGLMIFFYKITEGYYLLTRFSYWRKRHQREAQKLKKQILTIQKLLTRAKAKKASTEILSSLRRRIYYLQSVYEQKYPHNIDAILPTRFGNILRAAETHANTRYGIDAVPMWPRLSHVIPESHMQRVQQSNNSLAFLVNCMVLAWLLGLMCLLAAGYQFTVWQYAEKNYDNLQTQNIVDGETEIESQEEVNITSEVKPLYFVTIDLSPEMQLIYCQRAGLYLFGFIIFLIGGIFFYNASLTTVFQYGEMIRSSYDLFRLDLFKQFKVPLPGDLAEEFEKWRVISELIAIGHAGSRVKINLNYDYSVQSNDGESS